MGRRYQIFVSSTFRDLQAERKAALDAILEMGHFPAGMEIFPAADETAWDLIESVIRDCDYYILIIGGRYGSTDANGIGYTEKEYDLATKLAIPVLALLHADPATIPSGNSEMETKAKKKLDRFRKKIEKHHCKYWRDASELKSKIAMSLMNAFLVNPRVGWTRADGLDSPELLRQINDLRIRLDISHEENQALLKRLQQIEISTETLDEEMEIEVSIGIEASLKIRKTTLNLQEVFSELATDLLTIRVERELAARLSKFTTVILRGRAEAGFGEGCYVSDNQLLEILLRLMGKELVEPTEPPRERIKVGAFSPSRGWRLTSSGRALLAKIKRSQ